MKVVYFCKSDRNAQYLRVSDVILSTGPLFYFTKKLNYKHYLFSQPGEMERLGYDLSSV
jgi:hypothetical protein